MAPTTTSSPTPGFYGGWTREKLIERLMYLEGQTSVDPSPPVPVQRAPSPSTSIKRLDEKAFNFSSHPRRKVALKFCYSGWEYGGLAFQQGPTPLPTVENVLFDALAKAHLVDPEGGFEGCGWERCGRTDRGVSAAGQVVSLWVRSALPFDEIEGGKEEAAFAQPTPQSVVVETEGEIADENLVDGFGDLDISPLESGPSTPPPRPSRPEFDYLVLINRILPSTIRIIAWSPVASTFSSRFSCKWRHYKYFFSPSGLSIPAIQEAADRLVGEHDFRNLCKLDPQKQITSFKRNVKKANVQPLEGEDGEGLYVFNLIGSAFLYHQVRHIMAVLFLIGSGLEKPSLITKLMNVEEGLEPVIDDDAYPVIDRKPEYNMADALPLMLWDCGYDPKELSWHTSGRSDSTSDPPSILNASDLYHQLQATHSRSRIFSALDRHFLLAAASHHDPPPSYFPLQDGAEGLPSAHPPFNIPLGGGTFKRTLKYVPVLKRKRLEPVEVMNERWRLGKGSRKEIARKNIPIEDDDGDE